MATANESGANAGTQQPPQKKSKVFVVILVLLVVAGATFGITKYHHAQHHVETDDAQLEANISPIIPRVSGFVTEVRVKDNQTVKKGDTLLVLDDRDFKIKVDQAEAALATARSNYSSAQATSSAARSNISTQQAAVATADAQIETAKINVWRSTQDYNRYANLIKDHSITQQQYEQAQAAKETAERQLQVLQEQRKQASQQTNSVTTQSRATSSQIGIAGATIKQREVDVADARLNLSYTVITAPADGLVSKVNVQVGQFLGAGQATFSVVLDSTIWVIANYKETQFDKIQLGQKVIVDADAFPGHHFDATVSSFAPATGARFALLPPDNASGNFVKVVQRLPIKVEFTNPQDSLLKRLRAGMNVNVDVNVP